MLKIALLVGSAMAAVVFVATWFGEPKAVEGVLSDSIGTQVAEMAERGFDRVGSDRLDGATIISFERDGEEVITVLDKAGDVIGHWQVIEPDSL